MHTLMYPHILFQICAVQAVCATDLRIGCIVNVVLPGMHWDSKASKGACHFQRSSCI